ncbi:protein NLP6-like [Papaver somniferum]|uniref:protein NLP6-like n=1 Tax=Papaver somniferum TaxID=3469 RepID=UPI000E702793|nr:protein NLP6-like [Papaver somniferum]
MSCSSSPEEEEDINSRNFFSKSLNMESSNSRYPFMDLDSVDLDSSSWSSFDMFPLISNSFISNPFMGNHHPSTSSSQFLLSLNTSLSPPHHNPVNPGLSIETPSSPLWVFTDFEDKSGGGGDGCGGFLPNSSNGGFQLTNRPKLLSSNTDSMMEKHLGQLGGEEGKKKLFSTEGPDESCVMKERMMQALRYFKESMETQQVLAQVWAPVKKGDRYVLTTSGQPFVLDAHNNGLLQYRTVSLMYIFSLDGESDRDLGLPGRVFRQKLPEWTPNVQYYSDKEYQRLNHALSYNVRGTLALPVFETSGKSCIGVIELITTSHKVNYAPEVDKVCKALEAVNLKTSEIMDSPSVQICNEGRQNALAEILEILTVVCETHKLPMAQTWIPCRHRSIIAHGGGVQKSCTSFDGSCMGQICMSTTDVAFYVIDPHMWGFRDACSEHHLQNGQGVAGRAFLSLGSCFSRDITKFSKTNYPLVHYARMFDLRSSFAICLRSAYTGTDDYILEFFLPPTIVETNQQQAFLTSLFATMKQHFRNLKVASGKDLEEEERSIEIIEASVEHKCDPKLEISPVTKFPPMQNGLMNKAGGVNQSDLLEKRFPVENDAKRKVEYLNTVDVNHGSHSLSGNQEVKKTTERRRGKTEKCISLNVLQQYFSGSLKDAAKSLGVCPTTMKRICRQHGISRWPSRKINKVNRSLSKIKRVIESVHGGEGAFDLTSLTSSPLPAPVSSPSWHSDRKEQFPGSKPPIESPRRMTPGNEEHCDTKNIIEPRKGAKRSKTGSSSTDDSAGTPTSHLSCQGSPANNNEVTPSKDLFVSSIQELGQETRNSFGLPFQPFREINLCAAYSTHDARMVTELQPAPSGLLTKDSGSSADLRNLSNLALESFPDEKFLKSTWTNPICVTNHSSPPDMTNPAQIIHSIRTKQDVRTVSVKVSFKEAIIRFRVSLMSGLTELKEEIAKRLRLEVGTFEVKYLDDDHEWVLLSCDADLLECFDISKLSGGHVIRLLVHDAMGNFESSCESSGD